MKINKQVFEDVLSGKLKGTFVLKNGKRLNDNLLTDIYKSTVVLGKTTFYFNGKPIVSDYNGILDIIDFIPDTIEIDPEMYSYNEKDIQFIKRFINSYHMKENELTIEIPEGYCVDESTSTFEKIVFKKKDTKPRSWEEYLKQHKDTYCYVLGYDVFSGYWHRPGIFGEGCCAVPSKELAEAFLAMMQLMSLRQEWIGDWEPNYYMNMASNWGIEYEPNPGVFSIENHCRTNGGGLTFPTKEMATDFMNCFKDLLEIAKPLI